MATAYQIRELQRAENSFSDRYKLNQPHVPVDSIYGALTARESAWEQKVLGIRPDQIGHWPIETVTKWLYHPSLYFATHPGGLVRHRKELAALRAPHPQTGVVRFDNVPVAGWIADILTKARADGVNLRVSSGYRSYHDQWVIYQNEAGNGYPVAYPGTSHHQGINYPDGAVDVYVGQFELSRWLQSNPNVARGLTFAGSKDAVHFSVPGAHRPEEGSY